MNSITKSIEKNSYNVAIKLDSENDFKIQGTEGNHVIVNNNFKIIDEINSPKKLILKNISIKGVLNINLIEGNIFFVNVKADRININSFGKVDITIDDKSNLKEFYISNKKKVNVNINKSNIFLENIYVMPVNKKNGDTCISFKGNAENCKVKILTSTIVYCSKDFVNKFIEVNIKDSKKTLKLMGDFSNTKLYIINCKSIIGSEDNIPLNVKILILNSYNMILTGNLCYADIIVENTMDLNIQCIKLSKLYVKEKNKVNLNFFKNTIINEFQTKGFIIINGTLEAVKNAMRQVSIIKDSGRVEINSNNGLLFGLNRFIESVNKLLLYFIKEVDYNITIDKLKSISEDEGMNFDIVDLKKAVPQSEIFKLSFNDRCIYYTAVEPDANKIYNHEAVMTIKLSKGNEFIYKDIVIKGKYLYMDIDYENSCGYIEDYGSVVSYAFTQAFFNNIVIEEDIIQEGSNLYIENKNVDIDLNGKEFLLDNINIIDSIVKIKNGTIKPTDKITNWNAIENKDNYRCFVRVKRNRKVTELYCENITIPNINMDFTGVPEGDTNTILFYIGDELNRYRVDKVYLKGCSLELKKQVVGGKSNGDPWVIDTFADNTFIYYNNFNESYKCIKVNGCNRYKFANLVVISNDFYKVTKEDNRVLEVIPYETGRGVMVNDIKFEPNLDESEMDRRIMNLLNLSSITSNRFGEGSCMSFWKNQQGIVVRFAIYLDGHWQIPNAPQVFPDIVNNDMEHIICIIFNKNWLWSSNITQIIVVNTERRILQNFEYSVNGEEGKIFINNVILNEERLPIYQGILEPGNNQIIIKSRYFNDVKVNQFIKPIQIVKVVNGIGQAITRIEKVGINTIQVKLNLNTGELNIGNPINVNIVS